MAPRAKLDPTVAEDQARDPPLATTLAVLNALANAGRDCGVQELARTLGMPKPRIFRHLST